MTIVLCPGVHPPQLTDGFIRALALPTPPLVFPTANQPAYSGGHLLAFLLERLDPPHAEQSPLLLIGFSAGVVAAITAAYGWQGLGGKIAALIALDGWGVPLFTTFPLHRLSHDAFTDWSSALLGAGQTSFYAEPSVAHLDLWRSPQQVQGWVRTSAKDASSPSRTTASQFLRQLVQHYAAPIS